MVDMRNNGKVADVGNRDGCHGRDIERFPAKWRPVRVKKTRRNKKRASVPIQSEQKKALAFASPRGNHNALFLRHIFTPS
jgi:hypothetical protein